MDSMRSLDTSLPGTSPPKHAANDPPEQLLQAFKAAALSVTKLYKTAASDQARARSEGYQDALDELLTYLDKEDIGLNDGEGWKIRRWATERLDGRDSASQHVESDDETTEKAERAASPVLQRSQSTTRLLPAVQQVRAASPVRTETPAPLPISTPTSEPLSNMIPSQTTFTFRSSHIYPQDTEMNLSGLNLSEDRPQRLESSVISNTSNSPITITRPSRTSSRLNSTAARIGTRPPSTIGRGAGQKRKINLGEFFDIGNFGKDGFGGGSKRGRFI